MCESGFRYGELAGGGFADTCVPLDVGSTGGIDTSGGSTSTQPVTTTLLTTDGSTGETGIGESSTSASSTSEDDDSSTTDPTSGNVDCQVGFNDDFEGEAVPAHWVVEGLGEVDVSGGELRLTPSFEAGDQPIWLRHEDQISFRSAWLMVQVSDVPSVSGVQGIVSLTRDDDVDSFELVIDSEGWLNARRWDADGFTDLETIEYDHSASPWLRVRETEGRVFFETGASSDSLEAFHIADTDIRDWAGVLYVGAFNYLELIDDEDFRFDAASACYQP